MKIVKISIIIPCFNEGTYIHETLKRVVQVKLGGIAKEIILVDDGSSDATWTGIKNLKLKMKTLNVVRHRKNLGKGAAIRTGLKKVTGDIVIIQDADAEYNPDQYKELLEPFLRSDAQVVYGSRTLGIQKYHNRYSGLHFYWGGRALTFFVNSLYGTGLTDQPTGYKLFRKNVIPLLLKHMHENGFSAEVEMTATFAKYRIPIIEIPIAYTPRSIAEGKKIRLGDFMKSLLTAFTCRFF